MIPLDDDDVAGWLIRNGAEILPPYLDEEWEECEDLGDDCVAEECDQ